MSIMKAAISWLKPRDYQKESKSSTMTPWKKVVAQHEDTIKGVAAINNMVRVLNKLKVSNEQSYSFLGIWPNEIEYCYRSYALRIKHGPYGSD